MLLLWGSWFLCQFFLSFRFLLPWAAVRSSLFFLWSLLFAVEGGDTHLVVFFFWFSFGFGLFLFLKLHISRLSLFFFFCLDFVLFRLKIIGRCKARQRQRQGKARQEAIRCDALGLFLLSPVAVWSVLLQVSQFRRFCRDLLPRSCIVITSWDAENSQTLLLLLLLLFFFCASLEFYIVFFFFFFSLFVFFGCWVLWVFYTVVACWVADLHITTHDLRESIMKLTYLV